jgi:multicomponent Na+:H+ antiporter subunit F
MTLTTLTLALVLPLLVGAMIVVGARLLRGPHILDRVIALDFMTVVGAGLLGAIAIASDQPAYLDAAIVVAILSFLGTIGFAYYVEQRGRRAGS